MTNKLEIRCSLIDKISHFGELNAKDWCLHRQPKLRLRAAHKLDCFFHAMHNNDIGNILEFVWK